ncbi:MAG: hypothetical protein OEZ54_02655 [Gemmatimonadota bacterium]|nr:hypothetical protein [Gemmatimonadota bacterium]
MLNHNKEIKINTDAVRLVGYAFLILFFELAFIRYLPAYVRVFGFYLNFVLIATFLGMGVGLLRADISHRLRWIAIPATLLLFMAVHVFSNVLINRPNDADEFLWGVYFDISPNVRRIGLLPTAVLLFSMAALFFVPLGSLMGNAFRKFKPLHAYSLDISGSLLGILAFALLSMFRTEPTTWFAIGFAIWILMELHDKEFAGGLVVVGAAAVFMGFFTATAVGEYWSPYYRINVTMVPDRYSINVNGSFHQYAMDFDSAQVEASASTRLIFDHYTEPMDYVKNMDSVLVVGSGTGNDVALLLQQGAKYIDAVEIDPIILQIGQAVHFQAPYADPRVHAHVDDARAFFKKTPRRYDLIVIGTLDSQTLLSGMSSLRLDNYVYTVESFQAARALLKPGGILITYHMSPLPYIAGKIYGIAEEAFGHPPTTIFHSPHRLFNYVFLAGRDSVIGPITPPQEVVEAQSLPRDNWPYLYLRRHTVPKHYLAALGAVLLVGLAFVGLASSGTVRKRPDSSMFFMGVGFLLVETKSVSEMALLFGSTWTVNTLVFSSILVVILLANLWILRKNHQNVSPYFIGLLASLALAFAIPIRSLLWMGPIGQWLVGGIIVGLPILFAAVIFAILFSSRKDSTHALASNLLGAIVGGVLEYSSMLVGIKALYLVAAAAYLLAWLSTRTKNGGVTMPAPQTSLPAN